MLAVARVRLHAGNFPHLNECERARSNQTKPISQQQQQAASRCILRSDGFMQTSHKTRNTHTHASSRGYSLALRRYTCVQCHLCCCCLTKRSHIRVCVCVCDLVHGAAGRSFIKLGGPNSARLQSRPCVQVNSTIGGANKNAAHTHTINDGIAERSAYFFI